MKNSRYNEELLREYIRSAEPEFDLEKALCDKKIKTENSETFEIKKETGFKKLPDRNTVMAVIAAVVILSVITVLIAIFSDDKIDPGAPNSAEVSSEAEKSLGGFSRIWVGWDDYAYKE